MDNNNIEKELQQLANRMTRLETLIIGANGDSGLFSVVAEIKAKQREIREEQKKQARFQNLLIGALILLNIALPFLFSLLKF